MEAKSLQSEKTRSYNYLTFPVGLPVATKSWGVECHLAPVLSFC